MKKKKKEEEKSMLVSIECFGLEYVSLRFVSFYELRACADVSVCVCIKLTPTTSMAR